MHIRIEFEGSEIASFYGRTNGSAPTCNAALEWAWENLGSEIAEWCVFYPVGFDW